MRVWAGGQLWSGIGSSTFAFAGRDLGEPPKRAASVADRIFGRDLAACYSPGDAFSIEGGIRGSPWEEGFCTFP
jgi:hypothetical protein